MSKIFEFIKIIQTTVIVYYGKQIKIKFQLYFDLYILLSFVGISMYDLIILMGLQIFCLDLCGRFEIFLSFILSTNFFFYYMIHKLQCYLQLFFPSSLHFSPSCQLSDATYSFKQYVYSSNFLYFKSVMYVNNNCL